MPTKALAMALQRIGEREKLAKVGLDASGHYHDELGLFASQGGMSALHHILNPHLGATSAWGGGQGGGGSSISEGKEGDRVESLKWNELTSEEKSDRLTDFMLALQNKKELADSHGEREAAAAKFNRMNQFLRSNSNEDRARLMQEASNWHEQMRNNPTAGSRENLTSQKEQINSQRELAALASNINLKDPKVLRAVQAAAVRHMTERKSKEFRENLAMRTTGAQGTLGGLTGRIARAGYHASNAVRSANNAWENKGNLETLGRHLSELKSSLGALKEEARRIPGEAVEVGSSLWNRLAAAKDALVGVKHQIHQATLPGTIHMTDESATARNLREGRSVESTTHRGGIRII